MQKENELPMTKIEKTDYHSKMLVLAKELRTVEKDRLQGRNGCTLDNLDAYLDAAIANS